MPVAVEAHVPAWKKLGLKLKNASEPTATTPVHAPVSQNKRKFPDGDQQNVQEIESKPTKKAKKSTIPDKHSATAQDATNASSTTPKKPALRKSVSFAAGAKTEDGESAKDLYNSWLDSQKSSDPSFDPSSYNQDALKAITPTLIEVGNQDPTSLTTNSSSKNPEPISTPKSKKKKKKKRNKSKSTTLPKPTSNSNGSDTTPANPLPQSNQSTTTHPALTYLTTHQTNPKDWKFSKSRSSYLLRHLFSLTHIPASYTPALESYLSGLESQTAIQAIRQRALDIIKEDHEWLNESSNFQGWDLLIEVSDEEEGEVIKMDDPIKRKDTYLQALKQHKQTLRAREDGKEEVEKDREWQWKVARRKRVEGVLKVLNEHVYGNSNGLQITETANTKPSAVQALAGRIATNGTTPGITRNGTKPQQQQKGRRKRKRRTTGVPDDDSSSSSSSTSSSSSESEPHDDGERIAKRAKRIQVLDKKTRALKDEGSSGSESESDDSSSSGSGS